MQLNISCSYAGSSSFSFTRPVQQITVLDSTNKQFLRQIMLSQDGLRIVRGNSIAAFPISNLMSIAASIDPSLSWTPAIVNQPTASIVLNPGSTPNTGSTFVSASSESPVTYQWYIAPFTSSVFAPATSSAQWTFTTSSTATFSSITASVFSGASVYGYWNLECVLSNASGYTTSSLCRISTAPF